MDCVHPGLVAIENEITEDAAHADFGNVSLFGSAAMRRPGTPDVFWIVRPHLAIQRSHHVASERFAELFFEILLQSGLRRTGRLRGERRRSPHKHSANAGKGTDEYCAGPASG